MVYGGSFRARLHLAALRAVTTVRERRFELEESSIIGIRIALIINSLSATLYFTTNANGIYGADMNVIRATGL